MKTRKLHFKSWLGLSALAISCSLATPTNAQSTKPLPDTDTTRQELASFDQFLDSHRETAEQLRKDPSLVNNEEFLKSHPALQTYLQQHPQVREEIKESPETFMRKENRFDRNEYTRDRDTTRRELANFDQFLDSHRETAEQIRKDPSLVNNEQYVKSHPDLQAYLQQHPQVREEVKENPNAFMHQESRYERTEGATPSTTGGTPAANTNVSNTSPNRDTTRAELANFDQFLDSHRETAEQIRKDPSLVNNDQYVKSHPDLQAYLQQHPQVREEVQENPNAFMHQEGRYERTEGATPSTAGTPAANTNASNTSPNRDTTRGELANFDQFLDSHRETAEQLRKDPSLVNNDQYVKSHPDLQAYLQQHPRVREEVQENPNAFMHQEGRYERTESAPPSSTGTPTPNTNASNTSPNRDTTRGELANFDRFLDSHRETAEQIRKDPSLVNNEQFVKSHPDLQVYLQQHPQVREEVKENPNAFMHQEAGYERTEGGTSTRNGATPIRNGATPAPNTAASNASPNRDTTRGELANFDKFLDSHRETAEQVRKDPSLLNNEQFVKSHPDLQAYLQQHPQVREEVKENPDAFMHQEARYEHTEDPARYDRRENRVDRDMSHKSTASFGEFLDHHENISKDLSKNPSLAKNDEYMANHPELKEYLNAHPEVRQQLMANPQSFVASAQQFNNSKNGTPVKTPKP
ncbi:MAG TPA: hypothetical protein VGF61_15695 [Candidatus Acidoferrum sp.]